MRMVLTAAIAALMLSACAVDFATGSSDPRFTWASGDKSPPRPPAD